MFCGGTANSAEHVWPSWLRRREGIRESLPHVQVLRLGNGAEHRREWRDHPFKLRARAVCKGCNNGWMSPLERETEQIMSGMLAGRGKQLHRTGQSTLAAWALKTAMMFDQASPPYARVIPSSHYGALYETRKPPVGVRVWMAAYDATKVGIADVVGVEVTASGQEDPEERKVYARTFTVGNVAFQVFGTTNPALFELAYDWPEPNVHLISRYAGATTWMPRPAFSDAGLMSFGHRIVQGLVERALVVEP